MATIIKDNIYLGLVHSFRGLVCYQYGRKDGSIKPDIVAESSTSGSASSRNMETLRVAYAFEIPAPIPSDTLHSTKSYLPKENTPPNPLK